MPEPFLKALQETITSSKKSSDFFKEHKIETIFIDGQEYNFSQKIDLSSVPSETLHRVEPDISDEKALTLSDLMTWVPTNLGDTIPSLDYFSSSGSGHISRQSSSGSGYSQRL